MRCRMLLRWVPAILVGLLACVGSCLPAARYSPVTRTSTQLSPVTKTPTQLPVIRPDTSATLVTTYVADFSSSGWGSSDYGTIGASLADVQDSGVNQEFVFSGLVPRVTFALLPRTWMTM